MNISKVEGLAKKIYGAKITKNPLGNPMYEFTGTELAMFTELVVAECKSVLLDMMDDSNRDMDTLDIALTVINDKFGVE